MGCVLVAPVKADSGVWPFLRWSSTGGIASVYIGSGQNGVGLPRVYPSATLAAPSAHFLISISGGLPQQHGPPAEHMSIRRAAVRAGHILALTYKCTNRDAVDI